MKVRWMILGSLLTLAVVVGVVALGGVVLADDDGTGSATEAEVSSPAVDQEVEDDLDRGTRLRRRGFGVKAGWGHRHHSQVELFEELAEVVGVEPEVLRQALVDGQTLADVAAANGMARQALIDALSAEADAHLAEAAQMGFLDPEQLAFIQGWMQDGLGLLVDHPLPVGEDWQGLRFHDWRDLIDAQDLDLPERLAGSMGLTLQELVDGVLDGRSLAEIAQANGVTPAAVIDWLVAEAEAELDQALAAEYLTPEQADLLRGWVEDGTPLLVNQSLMFPGAFEMLERLGAMAGPPLAEVDWQSWADYDWAGLVGQDPLSVAAEAMDLSRGELLEAMLDGESLAEIAEAYDVELEGVLDAQTQSVEALLDDLVAEGLIPEHVPALVQGHLDEALRSFAEEGIPFGHGWHGPGSGGWFECCPCDEMEQGE